MSTHETTKEHVVQSHQSIQIPVSQPVSRRPLSGRVKHAVWGNHLGHRFFVWLHRWVGLAMAGFLLIEGLTGTILAFESEIERLISPQLFATPKPGAVPLDLAALGERGEALAPRASVVWFNLATPDQVCLHCGPRTDPKTGKPYDIGFDELFINPWTGEELGRRNSEISQGLGNLIPFTRSLHVSLALNNYYGVMTLGIVALVWTCDCFVGFYLTLPVGLRGFWRRWKLAWLVKWRASAFRFNFDLHRAGGLWFWPMLFVFAVSSVMMNMHEFYHWATSSVLDYEKPGPDVQHPERANDPPHWREAQAAGERLMAEQAAKHGFAIKRPFGLCYLPELGIYTYTAVTTLDVMDHGMVTMVRFDSHTYELQSADLPTGQHSGDTVMTWLHALHFGDVYGLVSYRILVGVVGLEVAMLSVTGIYIWWKKFQARRFAKGARRAHKRGALKQTA